MRNFRPAPAGVEEGGLFSDQVREARRRGLTEPDPRDDLSGRDTARKARRGAAGRAL